MRRLPVHPAFLVATMLIALSCSSCQRSKTFYPVRGSVFVDGKPAAGVTLVFHPMDDAEPGPGLPSAVVEADGSFVLKTFIVQDRALKEGAPAGQYRVTCVWYPADLQKYLGQETLPDKLQGRYADPKSTVLRLEVLERPTELSPIQLEVPKG